MTTEYNTPRVIALHCSLSSGRQWQPLADLLGAIHRVATPDLAGYGARPRLSGMRATLATEIETLHDVLAQPGPLHMVGHSYGGAVAFKIATSPRYSHRLRSLTLIEPILPTLLLETATDKALHDTFAAFSKGIGDALAAGQPDRALQAFIDFWNTPGAWANTSPDTRARLARNASRLAFDFTAAFAEAGVALAASRLTVPTLLMSGDASQAVTRRIVSRLAERIPDAELRHIAGAGHMLPITHAEDTVTAISRHIAIAETTAAFTAQAGA